MYLSSCLSVYPPTHLSTHPSICQSFICLSIYLSAFLSTSIYLSAFYQSIYLHFYLPLSIYLSTYLLFYLPFYLPVSIYQFIYLSICTLTQTGTVIYNCRRLNWYTCSIRQWNTFKTYYTWIKKSNYQTSTYIISKHDPMLEIQLSSGITNSDIMIYCLLQYYFNIQDITKYSLNLNWILQ